MTLENGLISPDEYPQRTDVARTIVLSHFRVALEKALRLEAKGDLTLKGAFKQLYERNVFIDGDVLDVLHKFLPDDLLIGKVPGKTITSTPSRYRYLEFGIQWALSQSPAAELLRNLGLTVIVYEECGYGIRASIAEIAN